MILPEIYTSLRYPNVLRHSLSISPERTQQIYPQTRMNRLSTGTEEEDDEEDDDYTEQGKFLGTHNDD